MPDKSVMKVKIMEEAGFNSALEAIALNKKNYDKDMYPVSLKLYSADGGHNKFLEMISVWIDYTTCRSIHQQIDTYRVGVTKSSESTHHRLIEDVLYTSINQNNIINWLYEKGFAVNKNRYPNGNIPINTLGSIISKAMHNRLTKEDVLTFLLNTCTTWIFLKDGQTMDEYIKKTLTDEFFAQIILMLKNSFNIDYDKYYEMFEGGSESITKDTIDIMVDLAMSLDDDRYVKLHRLKRMLPEGFLQRRIMHTNYKGLRTMFAQRWNDPFIHWQKFCDLVYQQVEHPEYFQDLFEKIRKPMIEKGIPLFTE